MRTQEYILCCGFGGRRSRLLPFRTSIFRGLAFLLMLTLSLIDSHHSFVRVFTFSEVVAKALPNKALSEPELAESTSSYPQRRQ